MASPGATPAGGGGHGQHIHGDSETPESILLLLRETFTKADKNNNGELDEAELAGVIKAYYKKEGVSRSINKVTAEVAATMAQYDRNQNGSLDFAEFLHMYATGETFRFQISQKMRQAVFKLELRERLLSLEPLQRLKGLMLRNCGGILVCSEVLAMSRVLAQWKSNRIRDGFRFFRQKAAALQARLGRMQAGLEPAVGTTPPETPRWMMTSPPTPGINSSQTRGPRHSSSSLAAGMPRSPSVDSDIGNSEGLPNSMLQIALQNEATNPQCTPEDTPRSSTTQDETETKNS